MKPADDILPPEKIAFIGYNIGVYESVQKFGSLITNGKITNGSNVSKVAELLSQSTAFYDADMIAGLVIPYKRRFNCSRESNRSAC